MTAILSALLAKFWPYIAGAVGIVVALFTARQRGRKAAQGEQARKDMEAVQRGSEGAQRARKKLDEGDDPQDIIDRNSERWGK